MRTKQASAISFVGSGALKALDLWGSWSMLSPHINPAIASWLLFLAFGASGIWVGYAWRPEFRRWLGQEPIRRDTSLRNAVCYAVHGKWPEPKQFPPLTTTGLPQRVSDVLARLRQLAFDGRVTLWGRETLNDLTVMEEIPAEFWREHQIDLLKISVSDAPNDSRTEIASGSDNSTYYALEANKEQIESEWPKPRHRLRLKLERTKVFSNSS
jgi:hypothetical protein